MKIILLLLLATLPCSAHLGESLDSLIARYGKQLTGGEKAPDCFIFCFSHGDFIITACLYKGSCVDLTFTKHVSTDGIYDSTASVLTDEEVAAILNQQADGKTWSENKWADKDEKMWDRSDGAAAVWKKGSDEIQLLGKDVDAFNKAIDVIDQKKKAEAAKSETNGL